MISMKEFEFKVAGNHEFYKNRCCCQAVCMNRDTALL